MILSRLTSSVNWFGDLWMKLRSNFRSGKYFFLLLVDFSLDVDDHIYANGEREDVIATKRFDSQEEGMYEAGFMRTRKWDNFSSKLWEREGSAVTVWYSAVNRLETSFMWNFYFRITPLWLANVSSSRAESFFLCTVKKKSKLVRLTFEFPLANFTTTVIWKEEIKMNLMKIQHW